MKYLFPVLLFFTVSNTFAQRETRHTISGFLRDSLTTENLIGATVYSKATMAGATANQFGFYSLTLPAGDVEIVYSYVGYNTQEVSFNLRRDTVINMNLAGSVHLQELSITGSRTARIHESTQMSAISVPMVQIRSLPAALGETDILKTLQLMPGIQSGSEGSSGFYVRGGGPDQNLILLDGVPLYNVSHMFGFVSIFNADAINNMEVIKGGFPARYGGRTSSVVDINLKEGNMQKFHGEGAIGLVLAKLTLEGPIVKDRTSFIISARRSYVDLLFTPFISQANRENPDQNESFGIYFYDLTAKINHRFSDRNRIYLSAYLGDDKFYLSSDREIRQNIDGLRVSGTNHMYVDMKWGNAVANFRWNHIFTNRLFANTMITYSRYRFNPASIIERHRTYGVSPHTFSTEEFFEIQNYYGIEDWTGKMTFDYLPSPAHYVRFGASAIYHTFNPGIMAISDAVQKREFGASERYAWEYSAYIEDDILLTERLKTNIGMHWASFAVGDESYNMLQPRIAVRYLLTPQLSAKASYSRMAQFIHLLVSSSAGLPTDLWVPSTEQLRPQTSDQIAVGLAQTFRDEYEISLEGYFKNLNNVMEYKEGVSFFSIDASWEQQVLQGTGRSYGAELFIQKKTGAFTGWAGYTLSWTDRHFEELNDGRRFPYKYDRRHDFSITLMQRFGKEKKHEISGAWVFGTGYCVTLPIGIFDVKHPIIRETDTRMWTNYYQYDERNGYRMKPYHRLDLSVAFVKEKRWGERRWIWSLYNAYNRYNPFYVDVEEEVTGKYRFMQYSLLPFIPSVTYQFKF